MLVSPEKITNFNTNGEGVEDNHSTHLTNLGDGILGGRGELKVFRSTIGKCDEGPVYSDVYTKQVLKKVVNTKRNVAEMHEHLLP